MQRSRVSFLTFGFATLACLLAAGNAFAWEWAYGPPAGSEQAFRRVAPVLNCPAFGPGYISVGTYDQFGLNPEVYVVFTDPTGLAFWEMNYDVQAQGFEDEGMAVAEVPGGFVILSNVRKQGGGAWMPALTMIKCHGGVVWSQVYPDVLAGQDLRGHDLIRLATGEPAVGTAPGDLAVAGSWWNGATEDAFLMRTDAAGNLIWNITHEAGGDEAFNALTEALPAGLAAAADIVAVGRFNKVGGDLQGLAGRFSGNTGTQIAIPHCLAQHGLQNGISHEVYESVVTLRGNANYAGQFAMVGTSTNPAWSDDVWLTRGNPCALFAQSRIGDPLAVVTSEHGNDLREIGGTAPAGILLGIAGDHAALGATYDASFLQVGTGNLLPLGGTGRLFGTAGNDNEVFFSLDQDPLAGWPNAGWVLAGRTQTDWQMVLDPQDLYLVHYDPLAAPACEVKWSPSFVQPNWPAVKLVERWRSPARHVEVHTLETPQWNPWLICP